MSLKITEKNGVFFLMGNINSITSNLLKKHMELLVAHGHGITMNIDLVKEIDSSGLLTLKNLYKNTLGKNQNFWITGNGSKEIYADLESGNLV